MRLRDSFATLALACAAPAAAQPAWAPPQGASEIAYPGETLTIRSAALGENVTVRIHAPPLPAERRPGAIVYALVDPAQATQLAAELRRRALEDSMYGVTVVTIARPGFEDEAWNRAAAADFSLRDYEPPMQAPVRSRSDAFARFLYDELMPVVEAEHPVAGERILAGAGWGGGFVLRMAATRPDGFDHHIAEDPLLQPRDVEAILAAGIAHPDGHAGHLDVVYARDYGIPAVDMERLLAWLVENGHAASIAVDGDTEGFIAQVVAGESVVPPI